MSCAEFVARSMAVRTAAHYLHLTSKSYAEHMALGDFYDGLADSIDTYAEVAQGLEGKLMNLPYAPLPSGAAIPLLTRYLEHITTEMKECGDSQALMNILAEIEELTARTLYKLRFLK